MAIVIILHLAPAEESHVARLLQRDTGMPVSQVTSGQRILPDHVYVIAPATSLGIRDGALVVGAPEEPHFRARPIDTFFAALAADRLDGAAGVVLSGTGSDGSAGLPAIRAAGGLCLVQDPDTAEYDGMPRSAADTGAADAVVSPEEMGEILARYAGTPRVRPAVRPGEPPAGAEDANEGLPGILALLAQRFRVDFRRYKSGTLERRTQRRIALLRRSGWQDYLEHLRTNPPEVDALYGDLLIGVTSFFRDVEEWELLAQTIVPELVEQTDDGAVVRAWSAGCATGEEAYGLAMVFLEHLEAKGSRLKLKVFASDASDAALAIARQGRYSAGIEEHVSAERLGRFFRRSGGAYEVEGVLREAITFANHDLLSDPPFAHLALVSCRNVLIYLEPEAQERLLERLHFSLRPRGVLWLGTSETIGRRTDLYEEVAGNHRIYRSVGVAQPGRYHLAHRDPAAAGSGHTGAPPADAPAPRLLERFILQQYTSPCVVIDQGLRILYFFGPTDDFLTRPQGEARLDLLAWVRPELYARLRTGLAEALELKQKVTVSGMRLERDTATTRVEIVIEPITSVPRCAGTFLVAFRRQPAARETDLAADDGGGDNRATRSERIQEELRESREELRAAVEQLRIVTEDHSASYEELLSLNEELQSSNEEIEASKEELQSLNEELTTINRQLEERNEELRSLTSDLDNLLVSAQVPTIFLDRELRIRRFTPSCDTLMRIVPGDVGRPLSDLKTQIRDETLLSDAQRVLTGSAPIAAEVPTDDGRWFVRRVLPYSTDGNDVGGVCLTFHEITAQKQATAASEYARLYAESIIRTSRTPLLVLDKAHRLVSANAAFYATFQVDEEETAGRPIYELGNGQWDIPRVRSLLEEALVGGDEVRDYDVDHVFERIGWRSMRLNAQVMSGNEQGDAQPDLILVSIEDVTDLRRAEREAQRRADELALDDKRKDQFLAMLGHELRNPLAALTSGLELLRSKGTGGNEPVQAMMERQTQRMTAMLDQLLDVARVISGKFELTRDAADMAEAARAAIESVQPMLETAGHELTVSLPPAGTAFVLGDAMRLAQVVENLLGNAAKYTEDGGRIWLTLEASADTVTLSVRDNGIGIEPAVLAHVYDLFTQAPVRLHRAKGGLGLGLALVRSLVRMHGGDVETTSAGPGKGCEVVVTLPRLLVSPLATPAQEQGLPLPVTRRRILIVDDELDTAEALTEILSLQGHQARAVPDGHTALGVLEEFHPEVVLLDLGLPDIDGYQVARNIRELLGRRVRLIALTGYRGDQKLLRESGFDGHLLKPTRLAKVTELLGELDERDLGARTTLAM